MTQETLDMVVHAYCEGCQEFIGDYKVVLLNNSNPSLAIISATHSDIGYVELPWEVINLDLEPKAQSEIIIELVKQIYEFGEQWLQDEQDFQADKAAEKWDNDRKSDLEN